jgi:hypothetical protein
VLDLFGGSGSTMIAAHKTGRRARLCELDPVYCDRILKRWETFAKDDAELIASGLSGRTIDEQSEGDRAGKERQVPADQTRKVQMAVTQEPEVTGDGGPSTPKLIPTWHDGSSRSAPLRRANSL